MEVVDCSERGSTLLLISECNSNRLHQGGNREIYIITLSFTFIRLQTAFIVLIPVLVFCISFLPCSPLVLHCYIQKLLSFFNLRAFSHTPVELRTMK